MRSTSGLLTLALLAGCAGGADDVADDGAADDVLPTTFGGDRPTELQVPATYDDARAYPLVVILHGLGASGLVQQAYFGLGGAADAREALILAPDGKVDRHGEAFWNGSDACCDFDRTGVDDVGYLGGLIDDVVAAYHVDPARIWVIGHSNGGLMAYRMACERADVVTGIVSLAGAAAFLDPEACMPERPVSVLSLHGDADELVPYGGGVTGIPGGDPVLGAVASVERWAGYDGCGALAPSPEAPFELVVNVAGPEATAEVAACPGALGVELWTLHDAGHMPSLRSPEAPDALWAWLDDHVRN